MSAGAYAGLHLSLIFVIVNRYDKKLRAAFGVITLYQTQFGLSRAFKKSCLALCSLQLTNDAYIANYIMSVFRQNTALFTIFVNLINRIFTTKLALKY